MSYHDIENMELGFIGIGMVSISLDATTLVLQQKSPLAILDHYPELLQLHGYTPILMLYIVTMEGRNFSAVAMEIFHHDIMFRDS